MQFGAHGAEEEVELPGGAHGPEYMPPPEREEPPTAAPDALAEVGHGHDEGCGIALLIHHHVHEGRIEHRHVVRRQLPHLGLRHGPEAKQPLVCRIHQPEHRKDEGLDLAAPLEAHQAVAPLCQHPVRDAPIRFRQGCGDIEPVRHRIQVLGVPVALHQGRQPGRIGRRSEHRQVLEALHLKALGVLVAQPERSQDVGHALGGGPALHGPQQQANRIGVPPAIQLVEAAFTDTLPSIVVRADDSHHAPNRAVTLPSEEAHGAAGGQRRIAGFVMEGRLIAPERRHAVGAVIHGQRQPQVAAQVSGCANGLDPEAHPSRRCGMRS